PGAASLARTTITGYLATHPGATPFGDNEVAYLGGAVVVTRNQTSGTPAGADCPAGWFCFYDRANFGYPRGRLSGCGYHDLGAWFWRTRIGSVHNNTSTAVVFYDGIRGAARWLFTAGPGEARSSVAPHQNQADFVIRREDGRPRVAVGVWTSAESST